MPRTHAPTAARQVGRPRAEIDLVRLRELAGLGLTAAQIADSLGISRRTLFTHLQNDESVKAAYDEGLSAAVECAARGIKALADQGNLGALIFFLKYRGGWKQDQPAPAVTVNLGNQAAPVSIDLIDEMAARQQRLQIEARAGAEIGDEF